MQHVASFVKYFRLPNEAVNLQELCAFPFRRSTTNALASRFANGQDLYQQCYRTPKGQ